MSECIVYVACSMTGRDKHDMVERAQFVSETLIRYGLTPISPVLEEKVEDKHAKLINNDVERLHKFWKRDKQIIRRIAHIVLLDHGEMKSFGMEREYMLSRGVLWKPTILLVKHGTPTSVAQFEDDGGVFYSVHSAAEFIRRNFGTRKKRIIWRLKMLNRSLLGWIMDQIYAFR